MLTITPFAHAQRILKDHDRNEWDGSDTIHAIAHARYAVVVERDDDSWVLAADTAQDVASIALDAMGGPDKIDAEWVGAVYAIATGEPIGWQARFSATVEIDGAIGHAQSPAVAALSDYMLTMRAMARAAVAAGVSDGADVVGDVARWEV